MTENSGTDWKVYAEGEESDDIPLWRALAQFSSEDSDEGLELNAAVINKAKPPLVRHYNGAFLASLAFGCCLFISVIFLAASADEETANIRMFISLGLLAATVAPQLWRQYYQYGLKTPDEPLELSYESDPHFDEFLGYLQRASAPNAYVYPRFGKKRIPVNRHNFFGKLRYFGFSEHAKVRRLVMRFRAGLALPSDIFMHRDDLEKMIALRKPKRKGGPGRNVKYRYNDSVISLIGDTELLALDFDNRPVATGAIQNKLDKWFKDNADESGDVPRGDQIGPIAEKIFDHLRNLRAGKVS